MHHLLEADEVEDNRQRYIQQPSDLVRRERLDIVAGARAPTLEELVCLEHVLRNAVRWVSEGTRPVFVTGHGHTLDYEMGRQSVEGAVERSRDSPTQRRRVVRLRGEELFGDPTVRQGFGPMGGRVR